jgi:hypothetical protein
MEWLPRNGGHYFHADTEAEFIQRMSQEIGPVLFTRNACADWLGCDKKQVERKLGRPDCFARVGVREDPLWLRSRVCPKPGDIWIDEQDIGRTFWTLMEIRKRICVGYGFARAHLPTPVATLKNAHRNCYLWRESQWVQLAKDIASGKVHVRFTKSLTGKRLNVYESPARHVWNENSAENQRIAKHRSEPAFWARMV